MADRLLDSNALSATLRSDPSMARYLGRLGECRLVTSVVVEGELRFGILRLPKGRKRAALAGAFTRVLSSLHELLPVTRAVARRYGKLKSELWSLGRPMGENDLWIAATALVGGFVLVTQDSDFERIPQLLLEDWSVA